MTPDALGNRVRREGVDRCPCGSKYWEHDRCVDCGGTAPEACAICERTDRPLPYVTPKDAPMFAGGRHCEDCERWLQTGDLR